MKINDIIEKHAKTKLRKKTDFWNEVPISIDFLLNKK